VLRKADATALFLVYLRCVQKEIPCQLWHGKTECELKIDEIVAEKIIPADDRVRLLDEIMEKMDYTPLMRTYKRTGRGPAMNPVTRYL
jgi:transposase